MSQNEPSKKRRAKKFLSPSAKYEIWLQMVRGEATVAEIAAAQGVDRSTIMRIRQVAKDGALAALAASRPGIKAKERDYELEVANTEIARPSEACMWQIGPVLPGGAPPAHRWYWWSGELVCWYHGSEKVVSAQV